MAVAALNKQALGQRSANYWLLLLSIDLVTFYDVPSTVGFHLSPFAGITSSHFFPVTAMAPRHPQPTTPMQASVVLMKK